MTQSIGSVFHAFVENPRDFITPKVVLRSLGSIGAIALVFLFIERAKDRNKPYIVDVIDKPYQNLETYQKLKVLLNKATGDISFWGTRCIYVEGYRGRYRIESFWARLDRLSSEENPQFSLEERLMGLSLVERINQIDEEADKKLSSKWFWTRGFNYVREWNPSGSRDIGQYGNKNYTAYTREQYEERFGKDPTGKDLEKINEKTWNVEEWQARILMNNSTK